jgi:DNA segregation ATPase FtsK/SpoIIIE, S-DNA-T family
MRPREYSRWVDPAPLEVERPRLPWWTLLPRKLLVAASPLLVLVLLGWLVLFTARKLWRYPVALTSVAVAVGLGAGLPWWVPVAGFGGLGAGLGLWAWAHRDSFQRIAVRQIRSEWRRIRVYAFGWKRTMVFSDLTKRTGRTVHYPRIRRVRADAWRDRVSVRLLRGQAPSAYAARAEELAHSFGARSCRVRVDRPRRIWLDFLHSDPLAQPLPLPALPAGSAAGVDLRRVVIGRTETGRPWVLRLLARHVLVAGATDAGKSSVAWSLLWALAPAMRRCAVQVFGIDPKGGMELGRAPRVFHRLVFGNGPEAVELLEHVATLTRQRAEQLRRQGRRFWSPGCGLPFLILLVDELADIIAYQPDTGLRKRANLALQSIISQGRAPGVAIVGLVQDPRKSVVDFRHLFPVRIAMRLDEAEQVDLVLGDGVRERGAAAHEIDEATPGVAWAKVDGHRDPQRARAFHPTDADLDALTTYLTATPADAPLVLAGRRAA